MLEISLIGRDFINCSSASTADISQVEIFLTVFQIRVSMSTTSFGLSLPRHLNTCVWKLKHGSWNDFLKNDKRKRTPRRLNFECFTAVKELEMSSIKGDIIIMLKKGACVPVACARVKMLWSVEISWGERLFVIVKVLHLHMKVIMTQLSIMQWQQILRCIRYFKTWSPRFFDCRRPRRWMTPRKI